MSYLLSCHEKYNLYPRATYKKKKFKALNNDLMITIHYLLGFGKFYVHESNRIIQHIASLIYVVPQVYV